MITDTDRRGAQVFASQLNGALSGSGGRLLALAPGTQPEGLDVPTLGRSRLGPSTLLGLRRELKKSSIGVAHGSSTLAACALAGAGLTTPVVYRQISDQGFWVSTSTRRVRVQAYLSRMDHVVALWSGAASTLHDRFGVLPERLTVIPNGVRAASFPKPTAADREAARNRLDLPNDVPLVLCIGALAPEKGVDDVVRAVASWPQAHLLVVGHGPERQGLGQLAMDMAPGRVHFRPPTYEPAIAYAAADVVALASRGGDSMPAVLIEAGLCALPSVATPVQGIVDIVLHGRTGLLCPIGDIEALVGGLREAHARRHEFGEAAREHCLSRFDLKVVAAQWEQVLIKVKAST